MKISQRIRRPAGWVDEDIRRIHAAHTDILVIRRPVPVECAELVARGQVGEVRFQTAARGAAAKIDRGLDRLELTAPGRQRARLADDILGLVCGVLAGFDWPRVEVRLDLADVQACPKFHCDNVLVRMVTTYVGPGTEYIETRRPDVIHRAAPGSLVFLKGHRHPTHRGSILHRSPTLPRGSRRLSVAIDRADWLTAILVALVLVATGCSRPAGTSGGHPEAGHAHDHHAHDHHEHAHDHADDHAHAAENLPAAVAEVVRLDEKIRQAFAVNDTAAADGPVHEIGHLLEQLPELAAAYGQGIDVAAVTKSAGLLFAAYSRIDEKLHGGAGSDYDTEAPGIARELATFRAFLVPVDQ